MHKDIYSAFAYLDGLEYVVIEVGEAGVLVHHAVNELSELQQECFAAVETVCPQRLDEMDHVWNDLGR